MDRKSIGIICIVLGSLCFVAGTICLGQDTQDDLLAKRYRTWSQNASGGWTKTVTKTPPANRAPMSMAIQSTFQVPASAVAPEQPGASAKAEAPAQPGAAAVLGSEVKVEITTPVKSDPVPLPSAPAPAPVPTIRYFVPTPKVIPMRPMTPRQYRRAVR